MTVPGADVEQPLEPLWRGLLVYRVLTLVSAAAVVLLSLDDYASPPGAVAVLVVMIAWTGGSGYAYLRRAHRGRPAPTARRSPTSSVTVAVMASTPLVQTPAQLAADAPVMGSIWTSGAVLACALAFGIRGGLRGGGRGVVALRAVPGAAGDRAAATSSCSCSPG